MPSTHPSILKLLEEARAGENAKAVMIRKCRALVEWAQGQGWTGAPHFDAEILASLLGIKVVMKPAAVNIGGEAALVPVRDRLEIWVKEGTTVERSRFSIFHEIAHTRFPDAYARRHNYSQHASLSPEEREFENLCDVGASELLFPWETFQERISVQPFMARTLLDVARSFLASEEATMHRVIEQRSWYGASLFLVDNEAPRSKCRFKVKYPIKHPEFGPVPWSGSPVPVKCIAYQCREAYQIERQSQLFWHVGGGMRCYKAEAVLLPQIAVPDASRALLLLTE